MGAGVRRNLLLGVEEEAEGARAGTPGRGEGERKWGLVVVLLGEGCTLLEVEEKVGWVKPLMEVVGPQGVHLDTWISGTWPGAMVWRVAI